MHESCGEFSKEYYDADGRAKEIDAQANAWVCPVWLRFWVEAHKPIVYKHTDCHKNLYNAHFAL